MTREYFDRFCEAALDCGHYLHVRRVDGGIQITALEDTLVWEDGDALGWHPHLNKEQYWRGLEALYEFDALLEGQVTDSIKLSDL